MRIYVDVFEVRSRTGIAHNALKTNESEIAKAREVVK